VTVLEEGVRRICGAYPTQAAGLLDVLQSAVTTKAAAAVDPKAVMPDAPDGYQVVADTSSAPGGNPLAGEAAAWTRTYQSTEGHIAIVAAGRYDTDAHAVAAAQQFLADYAGGGVGRFTLTGVDGAVGLRALALPVLWIQPPSIGPVVDVVVGALGPTAYKVVVGGLDQGAGHELASALAGRVTQVAVAAPTPPTAS
jgi:hypothetical protein